MSSEIILDYTSKFYTTRPHTQTHLQAGERWTSKFKLKQLCISNRRHLIRLRGWRSWWRLYNDMAKKVWRVMMAKNHCRAMTRKTLQIYCRWARKACHWCWLRHRRVLRDIWSTFVARMDAIVSHKFGRNGRHPCCYNYDNSLLK